MGKYVLRYGLMVLWGDQHSVFISGEFGKQYPTLPSYGSRPCPTRQQSEHAEPGVCAKIAIDPDQSPQKPELYHN